MSASFNILGAVGQVTSTGEFAQPIEQVAETAVVGQIILAYVPFNSIISGYLQCNGQAFDPEVYPALFTLLGSTNVPDLSGQFIRGTTAIAPSPGTAQPQTVQAHTHDVLQRTTNLNTDLGSVNQPFNASGTTGITGGNAYPITSQSAPSITGSGYAQKKAFSSNRDDIFGGYMPPHSHDVNLAGNVLIPTQVHDHVIPATVTESTGDSETRPINKSATYYIRAAEGILAQQEVVTIAASDRIQRDDAVMVAVGNNIEVQLLPGQFVNMNTRAIINLLDPVTGQDAATKSYVDTEVLQNFDQLSLNYASADAVLSGALQNNIDANTTLINNAILSNCLDSIVDLADNGKNMRIQAGNINFNNVAVMDFAGVGSVINLPAQDQTKITSTNTFGNLAWADFGSFGNLTLSGANAVNYQDANIFTCDTSTGAGGALEVMNRQRVQEEVSATGDRIIEGGVAANTLILDNSRLSLSIGASTQFQLTDTVTTHTNNWDSIQSLNFTPANSAFNSANQLVTRKYALERSLISTYAQTVGGVSQANALFSGVLQGSILMSQINGNGSWTQFSNDGLGYGSPVSNSTGSNFQPAFSGVYHIEINMRYQIPSQQNIDIDNAFATGFLDDNGQVAESTLILCLYDTVQQQSVASDMQSLSTLYPHILQTANPGSNAGGTLQINRKVPLIAGRTYKILHPFLAWGAQTNQQFVPAGTTAQFEYMNRDF